MVNEVFQILNDNQKDSQFGELVGKALEFLKSSKRMVGGDINPSKQSSKIYSDIHAFRKRSGFYKNASIIGLDETVNYLSKHEMNVRIGVIETERGNVAVWLSDLDRPVGVMISRNLGRLASNLNGQE